MMAIGLAKVEEAKRNGEWDKATMREDTTNIPPDLAKALQANEQAQRSFENLAPSHKRQFIYWITDAKRDEARQKRIREAVRMLRENKKLGMA